MEGALAMVEIYSVRLLEILISVWYSVRDTLKLRYSWLWAVARYALLLLCSETDWEFRVGKQGYEFILTDFKKRCFDVSSLTLIFANNYIDTKNFL